MSSHLVVLSMTLFNQYVDHVALRLIPYDQQVVSSTSIRRHAFSR